MDLRNFPHKMISTEYFQPLKTGAIVECIISFAIESRKSDAWKLYLF